MLIKEALAGAAAEAAVSYLKDHGVSVVDRDWRCDDEILAIVAAERSTMVVVDLRVLARARQRRRLEAVDAARVATLRRLGARWMAGHGAWYDQIRVDVIGVLFDDCGGFTIEHVRAVG
jgi:putative endonuclease